MPAQDTPQPTTSTSKLPPAPSQSGKGKRKVSGEADKSGGEGEAAPVKKRKSRKKDAIAPSGVDSFSTVPFDALHLGRPSFPSSDLISLAKTSKTLHRIFVTDDSSSLWSVARRTVGMPDLEAEMSEVKYALLLWGSACQICLSTKRTTEFDHHVRVRACKKCLTANLRTEVWIRERHPALHEKAFQCAFESPFSAAGNQREDLAFYYWLPDVFAVSEHLDTLALAPNVYLVDDEGVPTGVEVDATTAYVEERTKLKMGVEQDAKSIVDYQMSSLDETIKLDVERMQARKKEIHKRFEELGYENEDFTRLWRHDYIYNSTKRLTPAAWGKIKKTVLPELNRNKDDRLRRHRAELQRGRQTELKPLHAQLFAAASPSLRKVYPPHTAFIYLDTVRSFWEPDDAVIDSAGWSAFETQIEREVEEKVKKTKLRLFAKIGKVLVAEESSLPADVVAALQVEQASSPSVNAVPADHLELNDNIVDAILARPTALFTCPCGTRWSYPDVVEHVTTAHSARYNVDWMFDTPSRKFRDAVRGMLKAAARTEEDTTVEELKEMGECLAVGKRKWGGLTGLLAGLQEVEEVKGVSWEELTTATVFDTSSRPIARYRDAEIVSLRLVPPAASSTSADDS